MDLIRFDLEGVLDNGILKVMSHQKYMELSVAEIWICEERGDSESNLFEAKQAQTPGDALIESAIPWRR
jgi:hypothetical protein